MNFRNPCSVKQIKDSFHTYIWLSPGQWTLSIKQSGIPNKRIRESLIKVSNNVGLSSNQ